MLSTLDKRFKEFEELLRKELEDNCKNLEEKLTRASEKSYADALGVQSKECDGSGPVFPPKENMREIICKVRNEEKEEERERMNRVKNLIVHGVKENAADTKQADSLFVTNLLQAIGINVNVKGVFRLGKKEEGKVRPIKLVVDSEESRTKILESMYNLKGNELYKGVRVTKDHTIAERNEIRDLVKQAMERNENEPEDSIYEWKVRDDPKNGIRLMKFKKRNAAIQPQ